MTDDLFSELFHNCALVAFVEAARVRGDWPDSEAVRRSAYAMYERELANEAANKAGVL